MPRGPREAKGLLTASILDPNPVVFFEPKALYRAAVADVPDDPDFMLELGRAEVVAPGSDVTLVAWGAQVGVAERAAAAAAEARGLSCEVIDLQTLAPWDAETVEASVRKTGRLVVTHEARAGAAASARVEGGTCRLGARRGEEPPSRRASLDRRRGTRCRRPRRWASRPRSCP